MKQPVILICRCGHITTTMSERRKHLRSKNHLQFYKELERAARLQLCSTMNESKTN